MRTKTDQDILNFIEEFHIATSRQIFKLFYKPSAYRYCMTRLKHMVKEEVIMLTTSTINNCHAYFINKKPVQIHHDLIRSELYTYLKTNYDLLEWTNEIPFQNIRPDALCYIRDHGIVFPVLIEIHLNNRFNFDKYASLNKDELRYMFGMLPRVIICTDRKVEIPRIGIIFRVVGIDMSGLGSIFL